MMTPFYFGLLLLIIQKCENVKSPSLSISDASIADADDDDESTTATYLVANETLVKCRLTTSDDSETAMNVTMTFFEINGDIKENIVLTDRLNETLELEIDTARLKEHSTYSCCYRILNKSINEYHYCVNLIKSVDGVTPSSSNCSHNFSKSITFATHPNRNKPQPDDDSALYAIEYPVLIIIVSIVVLMAGACVKYTKRNKRHLIRIQYLTNDDQHSTQHHQQSHHQHQQSIFYIKPLSGDEELEELDLPPSYDDVMRDFTVQSTTTTTIRY